jgi:hypothetical protein
VEPVGDAGNYDLLNSLPSIPRSNMHDLDNLGRALELQNLGGMIEFEQTQWTH